MSRLLELSGRKMRLEVKLGLGLGLGSRSGILEEEMPQDPLLRRSRVTVRQRPRHPRFCYPMGRPRFCYPMGRPRVCSQMRNRRPLSRQSLQLGLGSGLGGRVKKHHRCGDTWPIQLTLESPPGTRKEQTRGIRERTRGAVFQIRKYVFVESLPVGGAPALEVEDLRPYRF